VAKAENALLAVRPGGRGDITASHVVWKKTRGLPYVPSPLFYDGRIYTIKSGGMASCFEAKSGRELWLEQRVGIVGDFYASPVAADGKIYVAAQKRNRGGARRGRHLYRAREKTKSANQSSPHQRLPMEEFTFAPRATFTASAQSRIGDRGKTARCCLLGQ